MRGKVDRGCNVQVDERGALHELALVPGAVLPLELQEGPRLPELEAEGLPRQVGRAGRQPVVRSGPSVAGWEGGDWRKRRNKEVRRGSGSGGAVEAERQQAGCGAGEEGEEGQEWNTRACCSPCVLRSGRSGGGWHPEPGAKPSRSSAEARQGLGSGAAQGNRTERQGHTHSPSTVRGKAATSGPSRGRVEWGVGGHCRYRTKAQSTDSEPKGAQEPQGTAATARHWPPARATHVLDWGIRTAALCTDTHLHVCFSWNFPTFHAPRTATDPPEEARAHGVPSGMVVAPVHRRGRLCHALLG